MKKNLFKVLSLALVALMAMTCVASAASVVGTIDNGTVTATVTGVGTTDEITILVVKHGVDLSDAEELKAEGNIIYIDQVTAVNGEATFTFASSTEEIDIYSGYTTMDVTQGALSDIYEAPVVPDEPTAPEIDTAKSMLYDGVPYDLDGYKRIFVKLVEGNGAWMPAHNSEDSEIYYSTEVEGYDGLIKTTAADLTAALAELTWENVAPTEEQTIAMYGDMDGDEEYGAPDYRSIKAAFLEQVEYGLKEYLMGDTNDDLEIGAPDYREIKAMFLETIDTLTTVNNKK